MIAGRKDALALSAMSAGFMSTLPFVATNPGLVYPGLLAAGIGAGTLTYKAMQRRAVKTLNTNREGFLLPSDPVFGEYAQDQSITLGYTLDDGRKLSIDDDKACRHVMVIGATGVGKTVLLLDSVVWGQMARGGGFIFIDAKLDLDTRDKLSTMAHMVGRSDDLMVINTDDPGNSNTYNPVFDGDGDEVASRLLNLIPDTSNSAGADHYKQQANYALSTLVNAFRSKGEIFHFGDLALLLQSPSALDSLLRGLDPNTSEYRALAVFLDQFRAFNKDQGGVVIDMKKLKDTFGGISGRIAQFANGNFGKVFNTYYPDINLYECIRRNKMVYIMLPTMAKSIASQNLAKMIVSDFRSAVAKVQNLPKHLRPSPCFTAIFDEFGSYADRTSDELFQQARSAGISLWPAFQSFANLSAISDDFAEKVAQNTHTKVFFKFASADTEMASSIIGTAIKYSHTVTLGGSEGASSPLVSATADVQESDSTSTSEGYKETEVERVTQDQLKALNKGECIVYGDHRVFHIRTSLLTMDAKTTVPFKVIRTNAQAIAEERARDNGINLRPCGLEARFRQFISSNQPKAETKASPAPEQPPAAPANQDAGADKPADSA